MTKEIVQLKDVEGDNYYLLFDGGLARIQKTEETDYGCDGGHSFENHTVEVVLNEASAQKLIAELQCGLNLIINPYIEE